MAAATKFYVYADGRWREVDTESGRVAGWSGRARFVFARRGRLQLGRARRVLAALRALAAGQPAAVRDGPRLSQRRCVKVDTSKKTSLRVMSECNHHHCCPPSHVQRCNKNAISYMTDKPQKTLKISTGIQCTAKADASTQAVESTVPTQKQTIPKLNFPSLTVRRQNGITVIKPPPTSGANGLRTVSHTALSKRKRASSSEDCFENVKVGKSTATNIKSKQLALEQHKPSPAKRKRPKSTSSDDNLPLIKQTRTEYKLSKPQCVLKLNSATKRKRAERMSSTNSSSEHTSSERSKGTVPKANVSPKNQGLKTNLRSSKTSHSAKRARSRSSSSVEGSTNQRCLRRSESLSSNENISPNKQSTKINVGQSQSKVRSPLKARTLQGKGSDTSIDDRSKLAESKSSSDESLRTLKRRSDQTNTVIQSNVQPVRRAGPARRPRRSTSHEPRPRSPRPTRKQPHADSQDGRCKELSIEETDIELLRSFLIKSSPTFDWRRFDEDDEYKRKYFYQINPLVNVDRCSAICRMMREASPHKLSLKDFASRLGLKSVSEPSSQPKRFKTRSSIVARNARRVVTRDSTDSETDKENKKEKGSRRPNLKRKSEKHLDDARDVKIDRTKNTVARKQLTISNNAGEERHNNKTVAIISESESDSECVKEKSDIDIRPPMMSPMKSKHTISNRPSSWKMQYSNLEDHAIVSWVSAGGRARSVNGNRIWRDLQDQYSRLTGLRRSWQSLRNRYLRHVLPALGALALPPALAPRLRAAAARGQLKSRRLPSRRNSIFDTSGARGASSRVRRAPPATPPTTPSPQRPPRDKSPPSPSRRALRSSRRSASPGPRAGPPAPAPAPARASPRYSAVTREFAARHEPRSPRGRAPAPAPAPAAPRPSYRPHADAPRTRKLYNPKAVL